MQFESAQFSELGKFFGFKRHRTTVQWDVGTMVPGAEGRFNGLRRSILVTDPVFRFIRLSNSLPRGIREQPIGNGVRGELKTARRPCARHQVKLKQHCLFRYAVSKMLPPPPTQHSASKVSATRDLVTCSQNLIRMNATWGLLQAPFEDPFKVLERNT